MKKLYIVYSDTHILAPHWTGHTIDDIITEEMNEPGKVFLTGDIVDRENAKKGMIPIGNGYMMRLKSVFGKRYIEGNHEGRKPINGYYYIQDEILFLHGHTIFWDMDKVHHWETKRLGQSKWKYRLYRAKKWFESKKPKSLHLKGKYKLKIVKLAKSMNCKTVVFGHSHRHYDLAHDGVRIINVPQGRTELWI